MPFAQGPFQYKSTTPLGTGKSMKISKSCPSAMTTVFICLIGFKTVETSGRSQTLIRGLISGAIRSDGLPLTCADWAWAALGLSVGALWRSLLCSMMLQRPCCVHQIDWRYILPKVVVIFQSPIALSTCPLVYGVERSTKAWFIETGGTTYSAKESDLTKRWGGSTQRAIIMLSVYWFFDGFSDNCIHGIFYSVLDSEYLALGELQVLVPYQCFRAAPRRRDRLILKSFWTIINYTSSQFRMRS